MCAAQHAGALATAMHPAPLACGAALRVALQCGIACNIAGCAALHVALHAALHMALQYVRHCIWHCILFCSTSFVQTANMQRLLTNELRNVHVDWQLKQLYGDKQAPERANMLT